jgi:hypothetical protein
MADMVIVQQECEFGMSFHNIDDDPDLANVSFVFQNSGPQNKQLNLKH